jgi:hypothetical protein
MLKTFISPLGPDEVVVRLKTFVDQEAFDEAHPEQFAGNKPLIGKFEQDRFTIHRKVSQSWLLSWITPTEWFKPFVYGWISRDSTGSRIDVEGSWRLLVKVIWVALIAGATGLIGLTTVFAYPYSITHDPEHAASNLITGIFILSVVSGVLIVIPIIGWFLTRNHLGEIQSALKEHLQLRES